MKPSRPMTEDEAKEAKEAREALDLHNEISQVPGWTGDPDIDCQNTRIQQIIMRRGLKLKEQ